MRNIGRRVSKKIACLIVSLANGGAEKSLSILLQNLSNECKTILVLMHDIRFYDIPKEIEVITLDSSLSKGGIKKLLILPFLALKYKRICKERGITLSFSLMNRPNYIAVLAKMFGSPVKTVISERAMPSLQHREGVQGAINRFLIKRLYPHADIVTANSQGNTKDLMSRFKIPKVKTIPNLLDQERIREKTSEKAEFRDDTFSFITVGRLDRGKNHALLLEAMKEIKAALYIIGDGVLEGSLKQMIKEVKLEKKVFLLGRKENPYAYLSQADAFVFSSNYEGFPNVLLEALACGLPIISTDCPSGPREILSPKSDVLNVLERGVERGEYGVLTARNDVGAMCEAMSEIQTNESLRESYRHKARKRADDFDKNRVLELYKEILCAP